MGKDVSKHPTVYRADPITENGLPENVQQCRDAGTLS